MDHNLKVGQTLFVEPIGNMRRSSKGIREVKIAKIGRLFFELEERHLGRFSIETLVQDGKGFISDYQCFRSMEEIKERDEANELWRYLKDKFSPYASKIDLPIEKMRQIKSIIENP